jgi:type I restriction enzyme R subunit
MSPHGPYSELGLVEQPALELLEELGWEVVNAFSETLGPTGTVGRDSIHDVELVHRLRDAVRFLNPGVPEHVREEAISAISRDTVVDGSGAGQPRGARATA